MKITTSICRSLRAALILGSVLLFTAKAYSQQQFTITLSSSLPGPFTIGNVDFANWTIGSLSKGATITGTSTSFTTTAAPNSNNGDQSLITNPPTPPAGTYLGTGGVAFDLNYNNMPAATYCLSPSGPLNNAPNGCGENSRTVEPNTGIWVGGCVAINPGFICDISLNNAIVTITLNSAP
jgi:hypothetical protein